VPARMLAGYLERQPQRLGPEEVERARERIAGAALAAAAAHERGSWRSRVGQRRAFAQRAAPR
jgi:hypothetical protein